MLVYIALSVLPPIALPQKGLGGSKEPGDGLQSRVGGGGGWKKQVPIWICTLQTNTSELHFTLRWWHQNEGTTPAEFTSDGRLFLPRLPCASGSWTFFLILLVQRFLPPFSRFAWVCECFCSRSRLFFDPLPIFFVDAVNVEKWLITRPPPPPLPKQLKGRK